MKNLKIILLFVLIILLFSSCAHTIDIQGCVEGTKVYGFWNGLWHGIIAPFTFIGHLINPSITIFAVNNNGGWYFFGFLLGVGGFAKGSERCSR